VSYPSPHVTKVAADTGLVSADVTLYDARGQAIQRKSYRYINSQYEWVTDGLRRFDQWYRPHVTYDPFVTVSPASASWEPDTTSHLPYATFYHYDILDRILSISYPDGTCISNKYSFDTDVNSTIRLATWHTDENGLTSFILTAPQKWTVQTEMPDHAITQYYYNAIGELTQVRDADDYRTLYEYDMFGNRTWRIHPDAGETHWNYAPDGTLISLKTSRLNLTYDSIRYDYKFNRLMGITYPLSPLNNVSYNYDVAGRLAYTKDATGSTRLYYDRMGNVRITTRRITMPMESHAYTFRTLTDYDSFGRIRAILYPDAEEVDYKYYIGGQLESVWRTQWYELPQPVVEKMYYNPMEHNVSRQYGNGTVSTYFYEPYRNRLQHMQTSAACDLSSIDYGYDDAGNIIQLYQIKPACSGLGGAYDVAYDYDSQYRLVEAQSGSGNFPYHFLANYSPAGRLGHSFCGNTSIADVDALYGYDEYHATHQPRVVFDYNEGILMELFWDADGNLFQVQDCKTPMARFHDWDEENRLRLMIGNSTAGYYGYDAKGERVYKLTSDKGGMEFDGDKVQAYFTWSDATLYPNPYLTITPTGYTKHYYANSERLSTVLGEGGWFLMSKDAISDLTQDEEHDMGHAFDRYSEHFPLGLPSAVLTKNKDIDEQVVQELQYDCPQKTLVSIDLDCTMNPNALYSRMYRNLAVNGTETNVYYTHNDHLGSASWITDRYAHPTQYLHYLPYGQLLANQKATTYDERYKFIGKERDLESGYDYFGARYYIPSFLHFASVEPLLDKYLHISPYSYAAWNPIKNVDLDGNSAKDKIMGWTLGTITNAIPLASLTNVRDSYTPDNPSDYNNSLQSVDNLAFCVGAALMASGATDIVGGTAFAEAGLAVATTGVGAPGGAGVAIVGGTLVGTGLLKGVIGSSLMANSGNNKGKGYSRGNSGAKEKSINQLQQDVSRGKAPKGITDFHKGKVKGEQPHVHFKDGSALNKDGTWKHGKGNLTNEQKQYLKQNGWNIE